MVGRSFAVGPAMRRMLWLVMVVGCVEPPDAEPSDAPTLGSVDSLVDRKIVQGVKWKNSMFCQDHADSPRFELHGLASYDDAIDRLCSDGVADLVLKLAEPRILDWRLPDAGAPNECQTRAAGQTVSGPCNGLSASACLAKRDAEILDVLRAVRAKNATSSCHMRVLIWERQWLDDAGKVDEYVEDMRSIIDQAMHAGLGDT